MEIRKYLMLASDPRDFSRCLLLETEMDPRVLAGPFSLEYYAILESEKVGVDSNLDKFVRGDNLGFDGWRPYAFERVLCTIRDVGLAEFGISEEVFQRVSDEHVCDARVLFEKEKQNRREYEKRTEDYFKERKKRRREIENQYEKMQAEQWRWGSKYRKLEQEKLLRLEELSTEEDGSYPNESDFFYVPWGTEKKLSEIQCRRLLESGKMSLEVFRREFNSPPAAKDGRTKKFFSSPDLVEISEWGIDRHNQSKKSWLNMRSDIWVELSEIENAIADLDEANKSTYPEERIVALLKRAKLHKRVGDSEKAENDMEELLELNLKYGEDLVAPLDIEIDRRARAFALDALLRNASRRG